MTKSGKYHRFSGDDTSGYKQLSIIGLKFLKVYLNAKRGVLSRGIDGQWYKVR